MPQDYGLLAMVTVFVGFLSIFTTLGFGMAIIQRREVSDSLLSSVYFTTLGIGCLLAVMALAAAPFCAWIYRDARVMPVMAALSVSFLLTAPGAIPTAAAQPANEIRADCDR